MPYRFRSRILLLLGLLASCVVSTIAAQAGADGTMPGRRADESVTVQGLSPAMLDREVHALVHQHREQQLARWEGPLCPAVVGLEEPFRGIVLSHLARWYRAVAPRQPGNCRQDNVLLFFTDRSRALVDAIVEQDPSLGRGYGSLGIEARDFDPPDQADLAALRADRPVRWYRAIVTEPSPGTTVVRGMGGALSTASSESSFLTTGIMARTTMVVVIVDLPRAAGPDWRQLADYVSFVVLGDPRLGATFGPISIMGLFDENTARHAAPDGMTGFDQELLRALYDADPSQPARSEQQQIIQSMGRAGVE